MRVRGALVGAVALMAMAGAVRAQAPGDGAWVPLEVIDGRLVATVEGDGGAPMRFLVVTTDLTALSATLAGRLGEGAEVALGPATVPVAGTPTRPDAELRLGGVQLAGVIGPNTLNHFDVLVDAPRGRLVLRPAGARGDWDGVALSDPIRLAVMHGMLLMLEVSIRDHRYLGGVDLGRRRVEGSDPVWASGLEEGAVQVLDLGRATLSAPLHAGSDPRMAMADQGNEGFVLVGAAAFLDCAVSLSWARAEMRVCRP